MSAQGVYDPLLGGGINYQDSVTPIDTTPISSSTDRRVQSSGSLSGLLPSGAIYDFSTATTRDPSLVGNPTNSFNNFLYTGNTAVSLTQPLLKNFGFGVNSATIRIARENRTDCHPEFCPVCDEHDQQCRHCLL